MTPRRPTTTAAASAVSERTNTFQPGFWRHHWMPALALMALSFILYGASMGYGYMLDDEMVIWKNEYVLRGVSGWRDIFANDSFMGYFREQRFLLEGGRYRPLSLATFALEIDLFGKEKHPAIGHSVNILLYGLTGVLLYRILLGFFHPNAESRWFFTAAFIGAALFVAHPVHSEAVANIKGRDEILALLLSLGALWASIRYYDKAAGAYLGLSALLLLLGMLAKENALTFLAVIPLSIYFFVKVPGSRILETFWPLLLAAFVFLIIRYRALGYMISPGKPITDLMNNPFLGMHTGDKLATIFLTLAWYLKLLVWPHPLTHDYYPYHVPKVGWSDWRALFGLVSHLGMGVWAVLNLKKRKIPAYAILFYLATLSIVSNLVVSVGTFMNERFIFMPSVAFCLLLGWLLARRAPEWFQEQADRPYLLGGALFALLLGLYGWKTMVRVPDWENQLALNRSAVRNSEGSARSHTFYVTAIYQDIYQQLKTKEEKGPWVDTMEYHIRRALEIHPDYGAALVMNAAVAAARFDLDIQMDKLFNEFNYCMDKIPNNANLREFVDKYIRYLAKNGGNPNKVNAFAFNNGYERYYKKLKDTNYAILLMEGALLNQTEDVRLLDGLAEIYQSTGNAAKATEMKNRANAMR